MNHPFETVVSRQGHKGHQLLFHFLKEGVNDGAGATHAIPARPLDAESATVPPSELPTANRPAGEEARNV